jgi:MoxR-like ATPase
MSAKEFVICPTRAKEEEPRMKLVGMEQEVKEATQALKRSQPVMFYGPTGNGKTLAAWEVAKELRKELKVPIVYLQLYPEMTKNSLIGGETIKNGSIVVDEQTIVKMGCGPGAIFIVDEATHTTEPVLLSFNSLIEEPRSTVIGNKTHKLSKNTRFVFCGNFPDHAGNIHLPISFANRLYVIKTGMPTKEDLCKIAKEANQKAPDNVVEFVSEVTLTCHDPSFPVSPRNVVTFSRAVTNKFNTGYKEGHACKIANEKVDSECKKHDIDQDLLKRTILSSLMANVTVTSLGPEKVEAMLWE